MMWSDCFDFLGLESQTKYHLLALSRQIYLPLKHYIFLEVRGEQCIRFARYLVFADRFLILPAHASTLEYGFYEHDQFIPWHRMTQYDDLDEAQKNSKGPFIAIPMHVRTVAQHQNCAGPLTPMTLVDF